MEFGPPPPKPEEEVTSVMIEKPSSLQEQSPSQIIQRVLGGVESGFELAIMQLETGEEVADEVQQDRGLDVEAQVQEVIEVASRGEEVANG